MDRRIEPAVALAIILAAAGLDGCSCKQYTFRTSMDESLVREGTRAVPIAIYFAPPEKSDPLKEATSSEWFDNRAKYDNLINPGLLVTTKAVAGSTIEVKKDMTEKVEKVFIWAANPNVPEPKPTSDSFRFILDPALHRQSNCTFDIVVKKEGLSVMANGAKLTEGVRNP